MEFNTLDLNNINLDDDNFYEDDPETILLLLLLLGLLLFVIDLNNVKHVKKINKKIMPIA